MCVCCARTLVCVICPVGECVCVCVCVCVGEMGCCTNSSWFRQDTHRVVVTQVWSTYVSRRFASQDRTYTHICVSIEHQTTHEPTLHNRTHTYIHQAHPSAHANTCTNTHTHTHTHIHTYIHTHANTTCNTALHTQLCYVQSIHNTNITHNTQQQQQQQQQHTHTHTLQRTTNL